MKETEFDKFADEYGCELASKIQASGEGPKFFAEYKVQDTSQLCAATTSTTKAQIIMNFGSGIGISTPYF